MRCIILALSIALFLSGCQTFRRTSSALPLDPVWAYEVTKPENDTTRFVGGIIYDSETKCSQFIAELTASESLSNTGLDMTTTALSALATAFTPLATVHALSSGAAISSGWKTAVDTDVFAKAGIANYAEAIQLTYYQNMHALVTTLPSNASDPMNASKALAEIQEIHQGCSLGAAQSTIAKTLQDASRINQADASSGTDQILMAVKGPFKKNDTIMIVAWSTLLAKPVVTTTYTVTTQTSQRDVADGMAAKINQTFNGSNVSASVKTFAGTTYLELIGPHNAGIKWSFDPETFFGAPSSQTQSSSTTKSDILPGASLLSK